MGDDVHLAARVAASGHGGQVLLSAATARARRGSSCTDLGEHRLKDIAAAVPIFQLGSGAFPPLKTISNTNLPRPASSFVGRERELLEVFAPLEARAAGDADRPRRHGEDAARARGRGDARPEYKAGVFWVGLAAAPRPGARQRDDRPDARLQERPRRAHRRRELLLLLDNLEQVVEAAPELSALLAPAPTSTCS